MFKKITIHLRGPICNCEERNLSWATPAGLVLECRTCKVRLDVPADQFVASFDLEVPYPGKKAAEKPRLGAIEGGKVLTLKQGQAEPRTEEGDPAEGEP